jgi:hypothetical protein
MEILTAYVRENAPWKEGEQRAQEDTAPSETQLTQSNQSPPTLAADIQAILTVLGRRTRLFGKGEDQRLNLNHTNLRGADLGGTHLEGVHFGGARLEQALLRGAHLERADLWEADLEGADLGGAHVEEARNLTVEQLASAQTLYQVHLDPPLLEQIREQYPHLLEKPQDQRGRL